ncbi:L,D-transpeptidase [Nakamurella aerolata]|uniref:L,D-transpeptidase family protein n=1 Tax=Nakamurella aerolata TaxID=1656892 RepID=A0A849A1J7_9ACTN|nr:Ig-like domain-containing protein [Nakamurella aerolata]NNG34914.1 L,D-transpeptidase family protein [Nakamurella aerolata]
MSVNNLSRRWRHGAGIAALAVVAALVAGCSGSAGAAENAAENAAATAGQTGKATQDGGATATAAPGSDGGSVTVQQPAASSGANPSASSGTGEPPASGSGPAASSGRASAAAVSSPPPSRPQPVPATVTATPAFGSDTLSPIEPATIKVSGGTITELKVLAEDGSPIDGSFSADRTSWTSDQRLRYGAKYRAVGTVAGAAGRADASIDGTWSTFSASTSQGRISPGPGTEVGVAAPVMIRFGTCVSEERRADVLKHLKVTTSNPVELGAKWLRHDGDDCKSLDLRPKDFWPANTKVTVSLDLLGVQLSDSVWGAREPLQTSFTVGRKLVTYADAETKQIVVKRDGETVATYPTSMGRGDRVGDKRMTTRSGIHVVTSKEADKKMTNEKFGYKDLPEPWSVRISNNGEFIHQNLASLDKQGKENVSHGCLNLSDVNAKEYFAMAEYGDPVIITGTSVPLSEADGDIYDWTIDFAEWTPVPTTTG